jgi:hypothetical protein
MILSIDHFGIAAPQAPTLILDLLLPARLDAIPYCQPQPFVIVCLIVPELLFVNVQLDGILVKIILQRLCSCHQYFLI